VLGDSGRNTGVLMRNGRIIVQGNTGDFTGTEMLGGEIFVERSAGNYACAKMRGGVIYARDGKPVPPAKMQALSNADLTKLAKIFGLTPLYTMMFKKMAI
ncbi:MAG: tributyrin esterase, partial [Methanotrichaceae archaeon]|nr:tributyrin esterase [Methanotrichaceae archaeon]